MARQFKLAKHHKRQEIPLTDPIAESARLRGDAKLLRDAKRQSSWLDVLFILPSSAAPDAAVTLLQRHLSKA